jgi:plastocyanin
MTARRIAAIGVCVAAAALVASSDLGASEAAHVVGQKGKQFSAPKLTLRRGEAIRFVNDDAVTHNVFSTSEVAPFNLKLQPPGSAQDVRFDRSGTAVVRCAIHPMMRLEVTVEP